MVIGFVRFILSSVFLLVLFSCNSGSSSGNKSKLGKKGTSKQPVERDFFHQALSLGNNHTCALENTGKVLCWGEGASGRLGNDAEDDKDHPVYVVDGDGSEGHLTGIVEISLGNDFACALKNTGKVLCWGYGGSGRLGNDAGDDKDHPVYVVDGDGSTNHLIDIVQVSAGASHACALRNTGEVLCWGEGASGQLGNNAEDDKDHSVYVVDGDGSTNHLTSIVQVSLGALHSCALSSGGGAYCWGYGGLGQLGSSNTTFNNANNGATEGVDRNFPLPVLVAENGAPLTGTLSIGGGGAHTCALLEGGRGKCWGSQTNGRLGNGISSSSQVSFFPVDVEEQSGRAAALYGMIQLFVGVRQNCGLTSTGGVKCWGFGGEGSLGNGSSNDRSVPTNVILGKGLTDPLAGVIHLSTTSVGLSTCVQNQEGRLLCWGSNSQGQLGNGDTTNRNHPVTVIDGEGSTGFLRVPTFHRTYSCLDGRCSMDSVVLALSSTSTSPSSTNSVGIDVSGLGEGESLFLYDNDACTGTEVGTTSSNGTINISGLEEGAHRFHFKVSQSNDTVTGCSKNFIVYVYDRTPPRILTLNVEPSSSDSPTPRLVITGAVPGDLVKAYSSSGAGGNCSAGNKVAEARSEGNTVRIQVGRLATAGNYTYSVSATDPAGNISSCSAGFTYAYDPSNY